MTQSLLPPEFADLEPFAADWCLPTERERFAKRMSTSVVRSSAYNWPGFSRLTVVVPVARAFAGRRPSACWIE